jgi:hypothetical protein
VKFYVAGQNLHNEIRSVMVTGVHADGVTGRILEDDYA